MTEITELYKGNELTGFRVEGHAYYSIPGRDIVCAAISVLTINTINAMNELSNATLDTKEDENGNIQYIVLSKPDLVSCILLKSALIGYKGIAEQYPENVTMIKAAVQ